MTSRLPPDIELSFGFRALVASLGQMRAAFVFWRLWTDLAYQASVHGKAGLYRAEYLHFFTNSCKPAECDVVAELVKSGFVVQKANGDLFCHLFYHYNAHLDSQWIPDTSEWQGEWREYYERVRAESPRLAKMIDPLAWYLPNGNIVTENCMKRATVLIAILDAVVKREPRVYQELEIGVIQAACSAVTKYSEAQIQTITRRFMSLMRPKLNPAYPATAEECLRSFEDLVVLLTPDEGFGQWAKRIALKPDEQTEKAEPAAISRELCERTAILLQGRGVDSGGLAEVNSPVQEPGPEVDGGAS